MRVAHLIRSLRVRFCQIRLRRFVGDVVGRRDLAMRPHGHVVVQCGRSLDRRHDGDGNGVEVAMLVTDVTTDVAAEVGTVRTRRATQPLQLLHTWLAAWRSG